MKSISKILLASLLAVAMIFSATPPARAQQPVTTGNVFYSQAYAQWVGTITLGNAVSGTATITLLYGGFTLPNGKSFSPFATTVPITVVDGSNTETVTPSAVSGCSALQSGPQNTCQITASFSNTHGAAALVVSGDQGIQEAINDAAAAGGGIVYWVIDGSPTLATGSANTNVSSINIPIHSVVLGAVGRVTVTIGTCAGGWSLGFSTGTEFTPANTTLTAGTTTDTTATQANVYMVAFNVAATPAIIHCTTSNASAGAVHARVFGYKMVAPSF